jgi:ATP-binding cassette subfamily B protein
MSSRTPCVRQKDQSDCGAAALATVAMFHGLPISVQKMRDMAGTDKVGTNLAGLQKAAETLGFSATGVKGPFEALADVPLPAIAHWKMEEGYGHFVVLYSVGRKVVVADPGKGILKLTPEQFQERWTGRLLLLSPEGPLATGLADGASVKPFSRFVQLMTPHKGLLAEAFACSLILTVLGLASSFFIQHLVDSVLVHGEFKLLNALAIGMAVLLLFKTSFGVVRTYLMAHVSRKIDLRLLSTYTRHVIRQPLKFFEMRQVGEIISRVADGVKVRQAVSGVTLTVILDATLVVIASAVMFWYDWQLALLAVAFVPALVIPVLAHHPAAKRISRRTMERGAALNAHMVEDVGAVETIKAFGCEDRRQEKNDDRLVELIQSGFSQQMLGLSMSTFGGLITGAAGLAILWFGGHRVIDGVLTIGQLMFFNSVLGMLLGPVERLASVNLQIQDAIVAIDRFYEILDLETEQLAGDHQAEFEGVRQELRLENVSFQYGCRAPVLKGVSLTIGAGETVAFVGESGSGKTTLLKLLMGFYEPTDGRISVDGMDLRDFTLNSLRSKVAIVSQAPHIFSGTIRENIAFGCPGASLEQVVTATRAAGLESFVDALPERYETLIGERGANLSGGQKQRLAIARALICDPEVLIFDEATSHLDTATERAIQQSMRDVFKDKTVILVAHRLSTIRDADCIYVLEDGVIVEHGTSEGLMTLGGRYAALCGAQSSPIPGRGVGESFAATDSGENASLCAAPGAWPGEGWPVAERVLEESMVACNGAGAGPARIHSPDDEPIVILVDDEPEYLQSGHEIDSAAWNAEVETRFPASQPTPNAPLRLRHVHAA